jgi:hypothetical protein
MFNSVIKEQIIPALCKMDGYYTAVKEHCFPRTYTEGTRE